MKVLMDGSLFASAPSGGAYRYLLELIQRLPRFDVGVEVISPRAEIAFQAPPEVKFHRERLPGGKWIPEGRAKDLPRGARRWLQTKLTQAEIGKLENAVYHSVYYVPMAARPGAPQLFTFHDMISELFPRFADKPHNVAARAAKKHCADIASRLIAISERTKQDIVEVYGFPAEKIDVVYHGVDADYFGRRIDRIDQDRALTRLGIDCPYFLHVGGRQHHKNFSKLAEAFSIGGFKRDYSLVLTGFPLDEDERRQLKALGIEKQVRDLSHVGDELVTLYQRAAVFVFPSVYEGFGLPLLEAMAASCPVAAARSGPFPEIAAEAAEYFDPENETDIAAAMERLLERSNADRLRELGKERVKIFNWDTTAQATAESYRKALRH